MKSDAKPLTDTRTCEPVDVGTRGYVLAGYDKAIGKERVSIMYGVTWEGGYQGHLILRVPKDANEEPND